MDYIFKFKRERTEGGLTLRPKIKATLSFKEKARDVAVILDTGSDLNYMPKDFADYFGLTFSKETMTALGAEQEFEYKTSKIYVKLENPHKSFRKLLNVMVPFKTAIHKEVIFGTDFLKNFIVTLDYTKGTIKLSENTSAKNRKYFR